MITPNYDDQIEDVGNGSYLHLIDIPLEQIAMYFLSEDNTSIQKSDILFYVIAYGFFDGITEDGIGIGSSFADVTDTYGTP
ncbi:MAG: hypothetical protein PVF73_00315 [Bacteroidales bacterium]